MPHLRRARRFLPHFATKRPLTNPPPRHPTLLIPLWIKRISLLTPCSAPHAQVSSDAYSEQGGKHDHRLWELGGDALRFVARQSAERISPEARHEGAYRHDGSAMASASWARVVQTSCYARPLARFVKLWSVSPRSRRVRMANHMASSTFAA